MNMIKLFFLLLIVSTSAWSQEDAPAPVISTDTPREVKKFNPYASHWLMTFGFEGLKYDVPYQFTGVRRNFSPTKQELWGGRMGVGGEIYLGGGFMTATRLEGFYAGTLFTRRDNATGDTNVDAAYTKRAGNIWGLEASQSLGLLFNMKTMNPILGEWAYLTVEPYFEVGLGRAWAYNRLAYDYNTNGTNEGFRQRVEDDLISTKVGGGINFTASTGYFLYLKWMVTTFDIDKRKTTTYTRPDQGVGSTVSQNVKDAKMDPVTIYVIGGGYKF